MADTPHKMTKEEAKVAQETRLAGVVALPTNFHLVAGARVRTAWKWIPRLRLIIVVSMAISIAALLGTVASVYTRPDPMVFLSLPDGTIACATKSDAVGKNVARDADYQRLCDRLVPPLGFDNAISIHEELPEPEPTPEAAAEPVAPSSSSSPPPAAVAPSVEGEG